IGTFALTAISEVPADANDNGSLGWTFTVNNQDPVLQSLAEGQTITQVYTITVSDGHTTTLPDGTIVARTVTHDLTATMTGTNAARTIVGEATKPSGEVIEDDQVVGGNIATDGTITFQDLDLIDTHTATVVFASSSSNVHLPGFTEGSTHIGTFTIDPAV